jgi:hypothetical protein
LQKEWQNFVFSELSGLFDDYAQQQDGTERENERSQQQKDPVSSKPTLIDFE